MCRAPGHRLGEPRERAAQARLSAPPRPAARRGFRGPAGRPRRGTRKDLGAGERALGGTRKQGALGATGGRASPEPERESGARAPVGPGREKSRRPKPSPRAGTKRRRRRAEVLHGEGASGRERACGPEEPLAPVGADRGRSCAPRAAGGRGARVGPPCFYCLEAGQGRAAAIAPGPWGGRGGRALGGLAAAQGAVGGGGTRGARGGRGGGRRRCRGKCWRVCVMMGV